MIVLVWLLFGLFGCFCIGGCIYLMIQTKKAENWIAGQAIVKTVDIETKVKYDKDEGVMKKKYDLKFTYQYDFEGQSFVNHNIYFGNSYWTGGNSTMKMHDFLSTVNKVAIFVNPTNPSESVLVRRYHNSTISVFLFGVIFLCISSAGLMSFWGEDFFSDDFKKSLGFVLGPSILLIFILAFSSNIYKKIKVLEYK